MCIDNAVVLCGPILHNQKSPRNYEDTTLPTIPQRGQQASMAFFSRCRLRGRRISVEQESGKTMSSRSDRYHNVSLTRLKWLCRNCWVCLFFLINRPIAQGYANHSRAAQSDASLHIWYLKHNFSRNSENKHRVLHLHLLQTSSSLKVGDPHVSIRNQCPTNPIQLNFEIHLLLFLYLKVITVAFCVILVKMNSFPLWWKIVFDSYK